MSTAVEPGSPQVPKPPLYCELEQKVKILIEENRQLRAEFAQARQKNKKFVNDSLTLYRNLESLLVENDAN
jgi:hypothetical protein